MFDPILVHEWLSRAASRHPRKHALICGETRWTYEAIDRHSSALAHALTDMGVSRHDRVAVLLDNSVESVVALYGILKAGAVFSILAATLKGAKLRHILDNSDASVLISHTNKSKVVIDALSGYGKPCKVVWVGPSERIPAQLGAVSTPWESLFSNGFNPETDSAGKSCESALPRIIDQDLAALIYTSGSTGEPKGVMLTHGNQVSVCRSITEYLENTASDIILSVLPLSFSYGLNQILTAFRVGATVILEQSFLYTHSIMQKLVLEKATGLPIVPTIAAILLQLDLSKYDLCNLRYITNAGAALPPSYSKELRRRLPHVRVFAMYGQTECTRISYLSPEQIDIRPTSVGRGIPGQASCVVDEQGLPVGPGVVGELVVKGPHVMAGYWGLPDETKQKLRPFPGSAEPALHTGDLFRTDEEGYLYFVSRKDDIIKSRGEKVSPKEVEDVLYGVQGVAEAAVVGVPDPVLGEAVKAFVVPQPGAALTERDVLRACAHHLEDFMVPQAVEFREALPKTSSGKIRKTELREQAAQGGASPR